ncbi:hypothetical protein TNCV_1824221 [Trichonephila clavipes]|nr:hypothetical protein TNCV_1824221 [Trichonephila clavipes]
MGNQIGMDGCARKRFSGEVVLTQNRGKAWHVPLTGRRPSPPRAGQPKTTRKPENIERVKQFVENDLCLTKRTIAEKVGIGLESVRLILTEDL